MHQCELSVVSYQADEIMSQNRLLKSCRPLTPPCRCAGFTPTSGARENVFGSALQQAKRQSLSLRESLGEGGALKCRRLALDKPPLNSLTVGEESAGPYPTNSPSYFVRLVSQAKRPGTS